MKTKKQTKSVRKAGLKVKQNYKRLFAVVFIGLLAGGAGITAIINQKGATSAIEGVKLSDLRTINPEYEQYLADVANGEGEKWDVIPGKYVGVENEYTTGFGDMKGDSGTTTPLPASYDIRDSGYNTAVKNQGNTGTCWAHGTISAIESFKKKNALDGPATLSTKQMDYLYTGTTPVAEFISNAYNVTRELGSGGNFIIASLGFTWGVTPVGDAEFFSVLQENDPYMQNFPDWASYSDYEMAKGLLDDDFYDKPLTYDQITSVGSDYLIADYSNPMLKSATLETIKRYIYENGAAYVGTTAPETDGCYDATTKTIIDRGSDICGADNGHAMTAIGWDDNHQYTDPATGTTKTGAFIIQNSWGTSDVWQRYDADTYDKLVALGLIDESKYTEAGRAQLKAAINEYIENYDANEFIYLAYESADGVVDFGTIMDVRRNDAVTVYSEPTGTGYVGKGLKDDEKTAFYSYNTGESAQTIESVTISVHGFPLVLDTVFHIGLEIGDNRIEVGDIAFPMSDRAYQRTIDLDTPVEVTGAFDITYSIGVNGSYYSLDNETIEDIRTGALMSKGGGTVVTPINDPSPDPDPTPTEETGEVTWVQGQSYVIGAGNDLVARIDYALNLLESVKLDGVVLAEGVYSLQSGSTIITVNHEFLDTLDAGAHELALAYSNGQTVRLGFTVAAATTGVDDDEEGDDEDDVAVPNTGSNILGSENTTAIISYALPATLVLIIALGISIRSRRN